MNDEMEVIAIFIDAAAPATDADDIDFTATSCLLRDASGGISVQPTSASDALQLDLENSGVFRRGTPIIDPASGEIIGYELEEIERQRRAVG